MTAHIKILTSSFILLSLAAAAQNAPVTKAGVVINAVPNESVIVPITVSNFVSIGAFTLTFRYRIAKATYTSATPNSALTGITVEHSINGNFGYLVINWPQTPGGVTLPNDAHLLDLSFTYLAGSTSLTWLYTSGYVCEYKRYSNGNYILLNDTPESTYYISGGISNRSAPVTTTATIANAIHGNQYDVPVTVTGYTSIGSMYLRMDYDSTALSFQSLTKNSAFSSSFSFSVSNGNGTTKRIIVGWYGSDLSLADESTIFTVRFTYHNLAGSSNYSTLYWYDDGPSCQYADAVGNILLDSPQATHYKNGLVFSQYAAKVWLPQTTAATPDNPVSLPVKIKNFSTISSFTLSFEYDTSALTYNSFAPWSTLASGMTVTNNNPTGSKRKLVITWTGSGPQTLPDDTPVADLNFIYKSGSSGLSWMTTDATSCRFNDAIGNAYYDLPKSSYYQDGLVASEVAPLTLAGTASPTTGEQVIIPILVYRFLDIGSWGLTLDYDPGVLTYQSATLVPSFGGTYSSSTAGAGRIIMGWSGNATSLPDSTTLINLTFIYNGGESVLAWFDNGVSCKYAASTTDSALYDTPRSFYYFNGYAGPNPLLANFSASNLLPQVNETVTFTDLSTGNPAGRQWSFNPPSVVFVNGTSATSQNPQVWFTDGGAYTVGLTVFNNHGSNTRIKSALLRAGTPGLWNGDTSTDWYTMTNWDNHLVPDGEVNVTIPTVQAGKHYPQVSGDLITTSNCFNIEITGEAVLTINGLFTLNPGTTLNIGGTGMVIVGN